MRKSAEISTEFAAKELLGQFESFFLVGIGGAGMSALARMLKRRGFEVRGTDSTASEVTDDLREEGIVVRIGHSGEGLKKNQAVILTDAIDLSLSPEVAKARELGCPLFRRSQALGWLLSGKRLIAVTGTHGKTTTTGMAGAALIASDFDPLVVVGAGVPDWNGPVREGTGDWAVAEACEAYDSFHDLDPEIVVLTNLELDHVDFHGNYENLRDSVLRFVKRAKLLVFCAEDAGAREIAELSGMEAIGYCADDLGVAPALPGQHNRLNAAGAFTAAVAAGAHRESAERGAAQFRGAERRLQSLGTHRGVTVVDDYAHHPSEIAASLHAVKEKHPDRRLVVVFQPHLYSRTAGLIPEFAKALSEAELVILTDIYPAREEPLAGVSSARIAELTHAPTFYCPNRHALPEFVLRLVDDGDVVVGMGAGNIGEFAPAFVRLLKDRAEPGRKTRVLVLYGGDSAEREISLHSGRAVHRALLMKGYESRLLDLTDHLMSKGDVVPFLGADRPDIAFLAVHGTHAEDGAIQGFLELLNIPYTGPSLQSSAICMDKNLAKSILASHEVRVPKGQLLKSPHDEITIKPPLIVKPNAQGSTIGLAFVESDRELPAAVERAFAYDDSVLVEEWIKGTEISVPVLGDRVLPPVEIVPSSGRYDFESKYLPGATEEIVPARISQELTKTVQELALRAHAVLGCQGATRTDMILRDGEAFVLELNTLPGLTGTSLLPNSARAAGIEFEDLIDWIVKDAMRRHAAKA